MRWPTLLLISAFGRHPAQGAQAAASAAGEPSAPTAVEGAATPDARTRAAGADPSINAKFKDPKLNVDEWVRGFEGESREVFAQRDRIIEAMKVQRGHRVADVGAGTGLFTFLLADAVTPAGKVFAIDVSPVFLRHIQAKARRKQQRHVVAMRGSDTSIGLKEASVDRVLICDTYHHFEKPVPMLASIRSALRPGGEVMLVDFKREDGSSEWTRKHVRAGEAEVTREFLAAGFTLDRREDFLKDNYVLVFKRQN